MATALALCAASPSQARSQACQTTLLAAYINPTGPGGCTIGNIALSWGQYNGIISNIAANVMVTPLSGTNALGSYFGFRFNGANATPLMSSGMTIQPALVPNPSYDPNDPSQGPQYLPYVKYTGNSSILNWTFTPTLSAQSTISRLELQTTRASATSTSQAPIQPTYLISGEPDVGTGCGWSIYDSNTDQWYNATQSCGHFDATSNNYLSSSAQQSAYAQTVWSSSGQYQSPDYRTAYCLENGVSVDQSGSSCTSFQDLSGVALGAPVILGLVSSAQAMFLGSLPGLVDPTDPNFSNYGSYTTLNEAEFRIYYEQNVVPEPGTWALIAAGLVGVYGIGRRRRART